MKVGRIGSAVGETLVARVKHRGRQQLVDLTAVAASGKACPKSMRQLIEAGRSGVDLAREAADWACRVGDPAWFHAEASAAWMTPLEVRNCIAAGRNFGKHRAEGLDYWKQQGAAAGFHDEAPQGFAKLASVMVPHGRAVHKPEEVEVFDYEVEVAAVIGSDALRVAPEKALDHVFGYTILNDLSAREWQKLEMRNQMILLGKNFPGFGPLGPWILTADEVPDPSTLEVELRVNGEVRQQASCADMIFDFPRMIAHWSRMGLAAGDLVTSGTPEGVAHSRKPDPTPFLLKPGDIVEATVPGIGTLRTPIV